MRENIKLLIGDMEVQFNTEPEIYYNYTETDLTNPTIVKNSYSKTVTVEGTPENNKIFGQFWDLSRLQEYSDVTYTGSYFNPSKKTPFKLIVNGELYESGYVKLDEVRKEGNKIEYDLTLYGGLGEFFYLLSYNDNGDKLKLSDLEYTTSGGDSEFDFKINKTTVNTAWNHIETGDTNDKWAYINFAPCYNGTPDGLSADKVLINFRDNILASSTTSGGTAYSSINGYGLGMLPADVDEWVVRDLRSWNQRPVIKMSEIVKACARYANAKGGYSISYDTTFFNDNNPYWKNTWLTLPKMDEITIKGSEDSPSYTFYPTVKHIITYNYQYVTFTLSTGTIPVGTERIDLSLTPILTQTNVSQTPFSAVTPVYTSCYVNGVKNFGGWVIQLVGYDGADYMSNMVAASDAVVITSKVGEEYLDMAEILESSSYYVSLGKSYTYSFGTFSPIGNGNYQFSNTINLSLDNTSQIASYALRIIPVANLEHITDYAGNPAVTMGYRQKRLYSSTAITSVIYTGETQNTTVVTPNRYSALTDCTGTTYAETDTAGYSGAKLTKQLLLDTESSPAEYLLSYAKLFGLYFMKYPQSNAINIMTRDTFYRTGNTINLETLIDRSNSTKITPIAFESKWYDMQLENVEGESADKYKTTYGKEYGIQRINTGYNFDNNSNDLYEDSALKGAVECTEKNRYLLAPVDYNGISGIPYYYYQGMTYTLYNGTGNTIEITPDAVSVSTKALNLRKYYDSFSKVEFKDADNNAQDGENVLLFYNGTQEIQDASGSTIKYYLTDDIEEMGRLNDGQACWLSTTSIYNTGGTQIAIARTTLPKFGRYKSSNDYLLQSLDFGYPKELFIPDSVLRENSTLYYNYWKDYITDLYDVNTKVLECAVLLQDKPSYEWLRDFYWFDNAIWRMNKIEDWKIGGQEPTKVEFVKVQDKANYTLTPVSNIPVITLSASTDMVGTTGGTVQFSVEVSDGSKWWGSSAWGETGSDIPSGIGDTIFTFEFQSHQETTHNLTVYGEQGQYSNSVTINQVEEGFKLVVNSPTTDYMNSTGDTINVSVHSIYPWTAISEEDIGEFQISAGTGGYGWDTMIYNVDANTGTTRRSTIITVENSETSSNLTFRQNATGNPYCVFNTQLITVDADAGSVIATISSNTDYELELYNSEYVTWISADISGGTSGVTTVTFDYEANEGSRREAYYRLNFPAQESYGDYETLTIKQLSS